jgi:lipid-binding SYLF domain-containing protein
MPRRHLHEGAFFGGALALVLAWTGLACAHAPKTRSEQSALERKAQGTLDAMVDEDPTLRGVLDRSAGYVVFPEIGQGAAVVGGAHGVGLVYEQGRPIGTATLSQGSVGPQIGGQTYSELIVFEDRGALDRLESGNVDFTAGASAVALSKGAGASSTFENGKKVFVMGRGGLMAGADVGGQKITFEPFADGQPRR